MVYRLFKKYIWCSKPWPRKYQIFCFAYSYKEQIKILFISLKKWNLAKFDNMDTPGGNYAKWNKRHRKTNMHNLIYLWDLQNKTRSQLLVTENGGYQWLGGRGKGKILITGYNLSVKRGFRSGNLMYSTVTTVNNDVVYTWNLLWE